MPDGKYGEALCACIVLKSGAVVSEEEMRDFCKGKIAHYKVSRYVKFLEEYPLTVTGKVQKFKLQEDMRKILKLDDEQIS